MAYILLILQQIIASSTHIVAKIVVGNVDPALLVVLRASVASVAALTWIFVRKKNRVLHRQDYARLFLLGLISVPGNQFGYLYGLHHTTPANAALLYAMTPAFVVLAQKFILHEQVSSRRMIAVAVAFAGAVIILFESDVNFGQSYFFGNAIIFLAVIAWTAYTLLGKSFATEYGVIESTGLSMAAGTILALPLLLVFPHAIANSTLNVGTWSAILYLGVVTSLIGYSLWYYALKRIPASRVAVFTNIQPVLTTVVSVAFMGVTLTPSFVIGGVIVLAGVLLTQLW